MPEDRLHGRLGSAIGVAVFAASLALAGCGSSNNSSDATTAKSSNVTTAPGAATTVAGSTTTLTIKDHAFSALTVKAGDSISIVNDDGVAHTVTADDGSFDVSVAAGATGTLVIPAAGTYAIHCRIHSSMHGTIVVT